MKITSVYNLIEIIEAIRLILKEKIMKLQNGDLHDTMRGIVHTIPLIINITNQGINHDFTSPSRSTCDFC
nr:MAG TPA: hypothetical protein [Bacteriophage sp.]DAY34309.1 MAG TPA: hypothetical protein [Caudoviricetes sp.]